MTNATQDRFWTCVVKCANLGRPSLPIIYSLLGKGEEQPFLSHVYYITMVEERHHLHLISVRYYCAYSHLSTLLILGKERNNLPRVFLYAFIFLKYFLAMLPSSRTFLKYVKSSTLPFWIWVFGQKVTNDIFATFSKLMNFECIHFLSLLVISIRLTSIFIHFCNRENIAFSCILLFTNLDRCMFKFWFPFLRF